MHVCALQSEEQTIVCFAIVSFLIVHFATVSCVIVYLPFLRFWRNGLKCWHLMYFDKLFNCVDLWDWGIFDRSLTEVCAKHAARCLCNGHSLRASPLRT